MFINTLPTTMIVRLEKNGVSVILHQTLNGFLLKTSFNPFDHLDFIEEMEKHFHVKGVENTLENGQNAVVFISKEYATEPITDKISAILEKTILK